MVYTLLLSRLQQNETSHADDIKCEILKNDLQGTSSRRLSIMSRSSSINSATQSKRMGPTIDYGGEIPPLPSFTRLLAMTLEWKQALLGCVSAILFGAIQPAYAFALGFLISVYFLPDSCEIERQIKIHALCFFGLFVFSLEVNIVQHYNFAFMGENLTNRIRGKMLTRLLTFEIGWFDQDENSSGVICSTLDGMPLWCNLWLVIA